MSLHLVDLDVETRTQMLAELEADVLASRLYCSPRLSLAGRDAYPELLRQAFSDGDCLSLANALAAPGLFNETEMRRRNGKAYTSRVPETAPLTLAEGEFNRFFIRGLCLTVLALGGTEVEVYRARESRSPRRASEALIGKRLDAARLLDDLREHPGLDTALGLPPGPNSGLSVRHPSS